MKAHTLLGNKTKADVLQMLCWNPDKEIMESKLAEIADIAQSNLIREIDDLLQLNIINIRRDGRKKFYSINREHQLSGSLIKLMKDVSSYQRSLDIKEFLIRQERASKFINPFDPYDAPLAKYLPDIAKLSILKFSMKGDLILDPSCSMGATLVEAALAGRDAVGINPDQISCLVCRAKIMPIDVNEVKAVFSDFMTGFRKGEFNVPPGTKSKAQAEPKFDAPYLNSDAKMEIELVRDWIMKINGEAIRNFFLVALLGVCSTFTDKRGLKVKSIEKIFLDRMDAMIGEMQKFVDGRGMSKTMVHQGDMTHVMRAPDFEDSSFDLILTSLLDYVDHNDYLSESERRFYNAICGFGGTKTDFIDFNNVERDVKEFWRVLKPERYAIINARFEDKTQLDYFVETCKKVGFALLEFNVMGVPPIKDLSELKTLDFEEHEITFTFRKESSP